MVLVQDVKPPFQTLIRLGPAKSDRPGRAKAGNGGFPFPVRGNLYAGQAVKHRLLVARDLRSELRQGRKVLLVAHLKLKLQPQKFPIEIALEAQKRRFRDRVRKLMHRRMHAEVYRRGIPSKRTRVRPAAVDPEGWDK